MPVASQNLWALARSGFQIDPAELSEALEAEAAAGTLEFRSRLLVRDGLDALEKHWGSERFSGWLAVSRSRTALEQIRRESLGPPGFPSLHHRLMESTK